MITLTEHVEGRAQKKHVGATSVIIAVEYTQRGFCVFPLQIYSLFVLCSELVLTKGTPVL